MVVMNLVLDMTAIYAERSSQVPEQLLTKISFLVFCLGSIMIELNVILAERYFAEVVDSWFRKGGRDSFCSTRLGLRFYL